MYSLRPWNDPKCSEEDKFKIFEQFIPICPTEVWKNILTDMSNGKLHKYAKYDGECLIYVKGNKRLTFPLNNKTDICEVDKFNILEDLMTFIETCIGVSIQDVDTMTINFPPGAVNTNKWSSIRKQHVKEKYISDFVYKIADYNNITSNTDRYKMYLSLLSLFTNGLVSTANVIFDQCIINITNVYFDEISKRFYILDPSLIRKKSTVKPKPKSNMSPFDKAWMQHLVCLHKHINTSEHSKKPRITNRTIGTEDSDADVTSVTIDD